MRKSRPVEVQHYWKAVVASACMALLLLSFAGAVFSSNANILGALVVVPLLALITFPIARMFARRDRDPDVFSLIMLAFIARISAGLLRYYLATSGVLEFADSQTYHNFGQEYAESFRRLNLDGDGHTIIGTGFIKVLTAGVYAVVGSSQLTGFLVFSWMGFLGSLLLWRAFKIGVPRGDSSRYALLVLFWPSMLFWPSSISKEAWVMLGLGVTSIGIAGLLRGRASTMPLLVLGTGALLLVRPHIALVVFVGLVFAVLLRKWASASLFAPVARIVLLVALLVAGLTMASRTATFLGVDTLTSETVSQELSSTEEQTGTGGSEFTPVRVDNPLMFPLATVTVLVRPFPFEAGNAQALASAGEGILLVGLAWISRRRIAEGFRHLRTVSYGAFSLGFVLAFIYAFSSFGNFGILTRQRVQVLPFLFVLFAFADPRRRKDEDATADQTEASAAST
jgi:hypothetical protein